MERRGVTDADGAQPGALQPDPDRGAGGPSRRCRRHDRRRLRPLPHPLQPRARRDRPARGRASTWPALSLLVMPTRSLFIADTYVNDDPDAETLAEITLLAADAVLRFGIQPKVALLSHSLFRQLRPSVGAQDGRGASRSCTSARPRSRSTARCTATPRSIRRSASSVFPNSRLKGAANLVICPQPRLGQHRLQPAEDARPTACISGRCCSAPRAPAHVLTPSVTARGILNMTALVGRRGAAPGRGARMSVEGDALDEVTPELVRRIETALAEGRNDEARHLLEELSAVGQAAVLEQVSEPERDALVGAAQARPRSRGADRARRGRARRRPRAARQQGDRRRRARTSRPTTRPACSRTCPTRSARRSWPSCRPRSATRSRSALAYPEDSAGRLMQRSLVKVPRQLERRPGDRLLPRGRPTCPTTSTTCSWSTEAAGCGLGAARPDAAHQAADADHSTSSTPTFLRCLVTADKERSGARVPRPEPGVLPGGRRPTAGCSA